MTKINDKKKADVNSIIGKQNEKLLEEINEAIEKLKHPSSGVCWRYGLTQEQIDKVEARDPFWALDAMLGLDKKPN